MKTLVIEVVEKDDPRLAQQMLVAVEASVYEISKDKLAGLDDPGIKESKLVGMLQQEGSMPLLFRELEQCDALLQSLEDINIAKLLHRPTIVSMHKNAAQFLSGTEVPYATQSDDGKPIVIFKPIGTMINLVPIIQSKEEVTLELKIEVSRLTKETPEGILRDPPEYEVRRVNTGLRMKAGSTCAIATDSLDEDKNERPNKKLLFVFTPKLLEPVDAAPEVGDRSRVLKRDGLYRLRPAEGGQ